MNSSLALALQTHREADLFRQRYTLERDAAGRVYCNQQPVLHFASNDYLGLSHHPAVKQAVQQAIAASGVGSGASAVVSGYSQWHRELESALALFTGRERVLLFSCGYMANLGIMGALLSRHDRVYQDRLNHASLLDAGRMAGAKLIRYTHGDVADLTRRFIHEPARRQCIVTEGVFSMDGDLAPLPALAHFAKTQQSWLMVDDSHGFGLLGKDGGGTIAHHQLTAEAVPLLMSSFGKAFGSAGAFVAGSEAMIETILQFGRTYIYTTAYPPHLAAGQLAALQLIQASDRREHLQVLINYFRQGIAALNLPFLPSSTAIQPLVVGSAKNALMWHEQLLQQGFWVGVMRPPTVPANSARLRITLTADHTQAQLEQLLTALAHLARTTG